MSASDGVEIGLGAVLVAVTLYDVFQSVVLPRPAVGRLRLSTTLINVGWRGWCKVAERLRRLQTREAVLAAFAPMMIVVLLVLWAFLLILGYALVFRGLEKGLSPQPDSFGTTIYFSAGRMLAFPVGGIEATGIATRTFAAVEAASGFGLFALVISLLFSLFSSFQRRETAVVALDALAGAPPSGVQLLERCAADDMPERLASTFDEWRLWTVDVLESHLSYPLLFYFRSSHDNEAWPNSFGAVMDAATLVLSTVADAPVGNARLMHKVGMHLVADMRSYFKYADGDANPGVEHEEFVAAYARLASAGYRLRAPNTAWQEFSSLRTKYAAWLNETTKYLGVPPASWIGDRSYLPHRERGRGGRRTTRPD
ncbi:MAG: hypothetical protein ACRENL_06970 [Candidatus Dormibacteria bacterium]